MKFGLIEPVEVEAGAEKSPEFRADHNDEYRRLKGEGASDNVAAYGAWRYAVAQAVARRGC
jgi:hypothetical protein